ncbi:MAG: hypothetical protein ACM3X7_06220 [Solirubrobacterales bacterium]
MDFLMVKIQKTISRDVRLKNINGRMLYSSRMTYFGGREFLEENLHINYFSVSNGLFNPLKNINITLIKGCNDIIIERTNDENNFRKVFKNSDFKKIIEHINNLILTDTKMNYEEEIKAL